MDSLALERFEGSPEEKTLDPVKVFGETLIEMKKGTI